ncbi:AN1-like Zinc finger [Natronoarchaeum philippinense]|uniref:AN1-like Zinc finger n=1 Tax=Natronoarchaeum philippinense TaxID=558529 RepID=A0A285N9K2_NATPI|nr:AN1-like Zinc finger [Natronoarchaeum philippinense]
MASCDFCSDGTNMPYECGYCGGSFCSNHRLPENHDCSFRNAESDDEKWRDESMSTAQHRTKVVQAGGVLREVDGEEQETQYETADAQTYGRTPSKDEIIDDRSPDVAVDGSIKREDEQDAEDEVEESAGGLTLWTVAKAIGVIAFLAVFVWLAVI